LIQRRQIAIGYTFAVPVLFAFLMVEIGALYRLDAHERALVRFSSAESASDAAASAFQDAEHAAQNYVASGSAYYSSAYADAASRVNASLENLKDASKGDAEIEAKVQSLGEVSARRLAALQRAMDSRGSSRADEKHSAADLSASNVSVELETAVAATRADAEARARREEASTAASASSLDSLVKYGGAVTIWIVGLAALLLFYDHTELSRERAGQRLHTDILESMPFGVLLTTESGAVLYANRAAEKALGYNAGELVAHSVARLQTGDPGVETNPIEILAQLTPGGLWSGELSLRSKEGDTIRGASWIASIRVGQRDCRLLIHSAIGPAESARQPYLHSLRPQSEAAAQIPSPLRAPLQDAPEPTTLPDSEAIAASHHAK